MRTAVWLYLFLFVAFFDLHAQYPILTPFAVSLGAAPSFIGLMMGLYSLTHLPGNLLAGYGVDRYGSRIFIVGSLLAAGVILILQSAVESPWQLLVLRSISGFVLAFLSPACMALLARIAQNQVQQGNLMSGNGLVHTLASVVSPAAGALLVAKIGFALSFTVLGWVLIITSLCALFFIRDIGAPELPAPRASRAKERERGGENAADRTHRENEAVRTQRGYAPERTQRGYGADRERWGIPAEPAPRGYGADRERWENEAVRAKRVHAERTLRERGPERTRRAYADSLRKAGAEWGGAEPIPWLVFLLPVAISCSQGILFFELPLLAKTMEAIMTTGLMFSVVSIGALVTLSMLFLNRYSPFWRTMAGTLLLALAFFGMAVESPVSLYVLLLIVGLAKGIIFPAMSSLLIQLSGRSRYGRTFSLLSIASSIGAFLGPLLAGHLRDYVSSYFLAFLVLMAVVAVLPGRIVTASPSHARS